MNNVYKGYEDMHVSQEKRFGSHFEPDQYSNTLLPLIFSYG